MAVKFSKYEGAGNDFVVIDNRAGTFGALEEIVAALCDRRFGIGADGLMLLEEADGYDFRMRYFNSDGPEASMCGNGGRCITLFAHHLGIGGRRKRFIAVDGPHEAEISVDGADRGVVALQMADVRPPVRLGGGWFLDTGSPHYVEFVEDVDAVDVFGRGRELRYSDMLAPYEGANINFAQVVGEGSIKLRTYERGVEDETFACGTGAVAAAIAVGEAFGENSGRYTVQVKGGVLEVDFGVDKQGFMCGICLTGPARRVFSGEFDPENFYIERLLFQKKV